MGQRPPAHPLDSTYSFTPTGLSAQPRFALAEDSAGSSHPYGAVCAAALRSR